MPLDFSDSSDEFIPFGGTAFAFFTDPNDSQNVVGEFYNDGSEPWQGFYIDLNNPIDLDPGQFHIYSNFYMDPPEEDLLSSHTESEFLPNTIEIKQN